MLRCSFLLLLVFNPLVQGRPVDLEAPSGTLGSSDAMGYVEMWEEVRDIDFGGGLVLPFRFGFTSKPDRESTVFGRGWIVPLLDSRAMQIEETTMEVELLCGKVLYLHRKMGDPTHFQTRNGEWKGLLDGTNFSISRDDGWILRYEKGRIAELKTDQGRDLAWKYQDDQFVSVDEVGGRAGLALTRDIKGQPDGCVVNGARYGFTLDQRPMPQRINDQWAIGEMAPSLSSFRWPEGSSDTFKYSLPAPLNVAALDITRAGGPKSKYTWDPFGHILSDVDWTYAVGEQLPDSNLPSLSRTNAAGQTESVSIITRTGVVTQQNSQGVVTTTRIFRTPGPYFNRVRDITKTANGVTTLLEKRSYDEAGRLIRSMDRSGATTTFTYDTAGKLLHQAVTIDPQIYGQLKQKAAEMLKAIAAAPDKEKLQEQLGYFYIHQMRDRAQALAYAATMADPGAAYRVSLQAIFYNDKLSNRQKIAAYQELLPRYPQFTGGLRFLIAGISSR